MSMRPWASSVWKQTPLWIKGVVFALCLSALVMGIGFLTFNMDCFHSSGGLCSLYPTLSLLALAAFGPGLFLMDPASPAGQTALVFLLPAAICSLLGAECFRLLGAKRGATLTAVLILVIDMGSFLIFMLMNIA